MKYFLLCFILSSLVLTSCIQKGLDAVLPQKGYEPDQVKNIKSVAIVSFDFHQFQPTGVASNLGGSIGSNLATAQKATNLATEGSNIVALETYNFLASTMRESRGWKVITLNQVVKNPLYKKMFDIKKSEILKAIQTAPSTKLYNIDGLIQPVNPNFLFNREEMASLTKSLGVDGLVIAQIQMTTLKNDLMGLGIANTYLMPYFRFYLLLPSSNKAIWYDYGYKGVAGEESIGKVHGMEDEEKIKAQTSSLVQRTIHEFMKQK